SSAPSRPSHVLPIAIPSEEAIEPVVVTLTRKAPMKMAGQTRGPSSRKDANAIPVGGHTGDTLAVTTARGRPSLPAAKYARVSRPSCQSRIRFGVSVIARPVPTAAVGPLQPRRSTDAEETSLTPGARPRPTRVGLLGPRVRKSRRVEEDD